MKYIKIFCHEKNHSIFYVIKITTIQYTYNHEFNEHVL